MPTDPVTPSPDAVRGRPLGFDRTALDQSLMLAFWEFGWNGASYPRLEQRTGVARSSLGNSIGPKSALLIAGLERYQLLLKNRLFNPMRDGEAGLDDIRAFFFRLREGKKTNPGRWGCLMAITMTEVGPADPAVVRLTSEYRQLLGDAISAALRRAHAHGEIKNDVSTLLSPALVAAAIGLNVQARAGATDAELDALVDGVNAILSLHASE